MSLHRRRYRRFRRKAADTKKVSDSLQVNPVEGEDEPIGDYGDRILAALKEGKELLPSICRYQLIEELGQGGMGAVFLAHQISEGDVRKEVAIKVLKDTHDESALKGFIEEAKLLAQLSHGTIVELLALESMEVSLPPPRRGRRGPIKPVPKKKILFMVQEYVRGPSLEIILRQHAENVALMHPAIVGFILNKAAIALAEAHNLQDEDDRPLNLVHRDISPGNILFQARAGITKLADFGVAKAFTGTALEQQGDERKLVGKPRYMAPEQLEGYASPASDIWSLGIIGYEALTGFSPCRLFGKTLRERVRNLKRQFQYRLRPPKDIFSRFDSHFDIEAISDIIMQCLELAPASRPAAAEMTRMLEGRFLYGKGLGPTNQTLAAYLSLLDYAADDGEIIPPPGYAKTEDAKILCKTLWVEDPIQCFRRRKTGVYNPKFVRAVKAGEPNPCLLPGEEGAFKPEETI